MPSNQMRVSSISATIDDPNSTSSSPPAYDDILKTQISHTDNQPPSYDSIYHKVKNARRNLRETIQNNAFQTHQPNQTYKHRLTHTLTVFLVFLLFFMIPVLKIAVGITYKENCPINSSIPLWLIIDGVFVLLLALSVILFKYFDCSLMSSVITIFLFSWLIRGSVWVYGIKRRVSFNPQQGLRYCDHTCYDTAFWTITLTWSIIGSIILLIFSSCLFKKNTNRQTISNA